MFAARITDMHLCPMQTPAVVPIPHVGGPITGPGVPNVMIGGMPASVVGDMATCVGPPDVIVSGATTVLVSGRPLALALSSMTAHGGKIILGAFTVMVNNPAAAAGNAASAAAAGAAAAAQGAAAAATAASEIKDTMTDVAAAADRINELQELGDDLSEAQLTELQNLQENYSETINDVGQEALNPYSPNN